MTRIEDLLRDSLAERAEDVAATPGLWHRVEARTTARTRRARLLAAAGTAVAVAVGVVVVPDLLDPDGGRPEVVVDPDPDPAPAPGDPAPSDPAPSDPARPEDGEGAGPSEEPDDPTPTTPPGSGVALPEHALRAVGDRLELVRNWFGEGDPELVRDLGAVPAAEQPAPIVAVVVVPGSTADALEAVALVLNEGIYEYWWVLATAEQVAWEQFPADKQPVAAAGDPLPPVPVFSPDHPSGSRYLAWVDHPVGGDQAVRVIGWTPGAGPGTGRPSDDNASFGVGDRPPLQLDAWQWGSEGPDGFTPATFTFTTGTFTTSGDRGQASALVNAFDRQPDGAISQGDDCFCGEPGHGSHVYEVAADEPGRWLWWLAGGPEGLVLGGSRGEGPEASGEVALPPALRDHPEPTSLELAALADLVVVTDRSTATTWLLRGSSVDTFEAPAFALVR